MRVDQHAQHAQGLIVLNESHSAHVCGEHIHVLHAFARSAGRLETREIGDDIFHSIVDLIPFLQRLAVNAADFLLAGFLHAADEMAANKAAAAGDDD